MGEAEGQQVGHRWLRPAIMTEQLTTHVNEDGYILTAYCLAVSTRQPLSDHQVRAALTHLHRKVPTLRLCFKTHEDGQLWACEILQPQLDFKVVAEKNAVQVMEDMLQRHRFQSDEGPLWCARLLPAGAEIANCPDEYLPELPHTRHLVLLNNHGIADGTTNCRTINAFLQILDDMLSGKEIDDSLDVGDFAGGEETTRLVEQMEEELNADPDHLSFLLQKLKENEESEKLLSRIFPPVVGEKFSSKIAMGNLDKATTAKFIKKCKEENVTVNSGFIAAVDVSLVDLAKKAGIVQDEYQIYVMQAVNMRRYWPGNSDKAFGCHISGIKTTTSTPANWRQDFWSYARTVDHHIHTGLKKQGPIQLITMFKIALESGEDAFTRKDHPDSDYENGNVGRLDSLIPFESEQVRLSNLARCSSPLNSTMFLFHTLHGRFMYSLNYSPDRLTPHAAQQLMHQLRESINALI